MGEAIGQAPSFAVGVAISPIPIIGVVLMLVTEGARQRSGLRARLADRARPRRGSRRCSPSRPDASDEGGPATWVGWLKVVLGALACCSGHKQWQAAPTTARRRRPKWMAAIDRFTAPKALGMAHSSPGSTRRTSCWPWGRRRQSLRLGIPAGEQAVAYAVFALVGDRGRRRARSSSTSRSATAPADPERHQELAGASTTR